MAMVGQEIAYDGEMQMWAPSEIRTLFNESTPCGYKAVAEWNQVALIPEDEGFDKRVFNNVRVIGHGCGDVLADIAADRGTLYVCDTEGMRRRTKAAECQRLRGYVTGVTSNNYGTVIGNLRP